MIVQTENGAGLEVYWKHRGARDWSYPAALRFLNTFRDSAGCDPLLRRLVGGHDATGVSWRLSPTLVVEQTARLIASGRIFIVEARSPFRWPGTGILLRSRWRTVMLIRQDALTPARDLSKAYGWIKALRDRQAEVDDFIDDSAEPGRPKSQYKQAAEDHQHAVARLRRILAESDWAPNYTFYPDKAFLQQVEQALQTGLLIPIYHPVAGASDAVQEGGPAPPPAQASAGPREQEPENATFESDHDAAIQAAALNTAAQDGIPFCEECKKDAMRRRAAS